MGRGDLKGATKMPMRSEGRGVPIEVILLVAVGICIAILIGWGIYLFG